MVTGETPIRCPATSGKGDAKREEREQLKRESKLYIYIYNGRLIKIQLIDPFEVQKTSI